MYGIRWAKFGQRPAAKPVGEYFDRNRAFAPSIWVMTEMTASVQYDSVVPVVEAAQQGDEFAFGELLRRQDRWVRGVVMGVLGDRDRLDDVAQQVWTTVWQKIGSLKDTARWRPWLYRIARNAAVDACRASSSRRELPVGEFGDSGTDATPVTHLVTGEKDAAVRSAIESLPPLYREPFVLKHIDGWSYREIAKLMDIPVDTVETRLVRARRLLRSALKGKI